MSKPKRIEGTTNYCNGCEGEVVPAGAPVVEVQAGADDYEFSSPPVHLCFRCVKAALDELTRPA